MRTQKQANRNGEAGFTLLEVMIAAGVTGVVALAGMSVTLSSLSLDAVNRERSDALAVATQIMESVDSMTIPDVVAHFNDLPGDDPWGAGSGAGSVFTVDRSAASRSGPVQAAANLATERSIAVEVRLPINADGTYSSAAASRIYPAVPWAVHANGELVRRDQMEMPDSSTELIPIAISVSWVSVTGQTQTIELTRLVRADDRKSDASASVAPPMKAIKKSLKSSRRKARLLEQKRRLRMQRLYGVQSGV